VGHGIFHGWFWGLPIAAAVLAYGLFSALFVLIAGDLVVQPKQGSPGFPHPTK
jgi:hypothetical protein